jgi:protein TonB
MRSALFFILSVGLHAAALAYPVTVARRGHSEAIRVIVLPEEAEPGGGGGSGGSGNSAPSGKPKSTFTGRANAAPRIEANAVNANPEPDIAAAAEIETVTESSVAWTWARGFSSESNMDLVSAKPIGLGGESGAAGSGTGGNGAGTGSGSGFGAALGSRPGGSGSGVIRAEARYRETPRPEYPDSARRHGREGRVLLRVLVDDQGRARQIEINRSSGSDILDRAAAEAMKRWRFYPARAGDKAIESWLRVPIEFRLDDATAR